MKFKVSNIKYDTKESIVAEELDLQLPTNMEIECDSEEEIADTISDLTGWLVESFNIE